MSTPELGLELLSVVARLNRWATRHATLEVSPARARLLAQLQEVGPVRIGDLARADHCSQPTMTAQVQRLESQGWTTRRPDPTDARASLVELSPDGLRALEQVRRARSAVVAPLIDRLDTGERETLRRALTVLGRIVDDAASTPLSLEP